MESHTTRPWFLFCAIAVLALGLTLTDAWHATGSVLAELLIAAVIYYEIEETRIGAFLNDVLGRAYKERRLVYEAFMEMEGTTIDEKATVFVKHIWQTPRLRSVCDYQLTYFSQAHYMVRGSLFHRHLVSDWFPQVVVRMWAMLSVYAMDSERLAIRAGRELAEEVVNSIERLHKNGIEKLVIHSKAGEKIVISAADIDRLKKSAKQYLKTGIRWEGPAQAQGASGGR